MSAPICFAPSTLFIGLIGLVVSVIFCMSICKQCYPKQIDASPIPLPPLPPAPAVQPPMYPTETPKLPAFPQVGIPSNPVSVSLVPLPNTPTTPNVSRFDTSYHQLGYVQADNSTTRLVMPLYGRRKIARNDRFEYYVIDAENIKIPFAQRNEAEIYDKDPVTIPGFSESFKAMMYPQDEIAYNPFN